MPADWPTLDALRAKRDRMRKRLANVKSGKAQAKAEWEPLFLELYLRDMTATIDRLAAVLGRRPRSRPETHSGAV
jgi:hypothetical protein